jgi:hypothetical protein
MHLDGLKYIYIYIDSSWKMSLTNCRDGRSLLWDSYEIKNLISKCILYAILNWFDKVQYKAFKPIGLPPWTAAQIVPVPCSTRIEHLCLQVGLYLDVLNTNCMYKLMLFYPNIINALNIFSFCSNG